MSDSVGQYLNEIGLVPLLTAQEERELSKIIERGAEARAKKEEGETGRDLDRAIREAAVAKDRFIRANLRLVVSVARRYPLPPGMELLDLIQEGNLGLSTQSTSSTGARASSSRRTQRSGFARPLAVRSTKRQASCAFLAIVPQACAPHFVRFLATATSLTKNTHACTV